VVGVSAAGDIELEFEGACRACALKTVTYAIAVRERLRELPGVRDVTVRGVNLSRAALDRVSVRQAMDFQRRWPTEARVSTRS
jgi:hypothetical protein